MFKTLGTIAFFFYTAFSEFPIANASPSATVLEPGDPCIVAENSINAVTDSWDRQKEINSVAFKACLLSVKDSHKRSCANGCVAQWKQWTCHSENRLTDQLKGIAKSDSDCYIYKGKDAQDCGKSFAMGDYCKNVGTWRAK